MRASRLLIGIVLALSLGWEIPAISVAYAAASPASPSTDIAAAGSNGPVCIVVPVTTSSIGGQGNCPKGQVEVSNDPAKGGAIIVYLKEILFVVNILVGGVILLVMVIAGIQYITSAGDPGGVKNAKGRIQAAMTALILYLMMFAILSFLVPGGIL